LKPIDHAALRRRGFAKQEPEPSWAWAAKSVDYSRAQNYDTPYRGPFDPELMPFWKEPLEAAQLPDVREIAILKCSRAGYSENLVLTDLRYTVARNPEPTLYVTGKMEIAKGFLDRRIARGMELSAETRREYRAAKTVGTDIQFPSMDFRATWASSDTATKSDGWARIHADEVSLWSEFTCDAVRRRCAAYPFHHIVYGGSIDFERRGDPNDDPMLKLYAESDRRVWTMTDENGQDFTFQFSGLQWDQAAKSGDDWDIDRAAASAYYQTPSGVVVTDADRMRVVRAGRWVVTNPHGIRRGYKVVAPMVPFADCTFANLVRQFLSAKTRMSDATKDARERNTLRTYFAEMWAEPHFAKAEFATEENLIDRVGEYSYGERMGESAAYKLHYVGAPTGIYVTVDVQKDHLWVCVREWIAANGGDSALVEFFQASTWKEVFDAATKWKAERVYCDAGYPLRKAEVYEIAMKTPGFVPVVGSDKLNALYRRSNIDPYEGTIRQGKVGTITLYTINPDMFRSILLDSINGKTVQRWAIPRGTPMDYQRQVTSTKKVMGEWKSVRRDDHAFDCETLQIFAAIRHRVLRILKDQPTEQDAEHVPCEVLD
jgi:hypothetical protein